MNRPGIFVYGGTILPGIHKEKISISCRFSKLSVPHASGQIDEEELTNIEKKAIPGPGSCGGMYTANTMSSAIEALGMSLPDSSAQLAVSEDKKIDAKDAGAAVVNLIEKDIKPRDIMTRKAFENAITVVITLGGSTNAVLHFCLQWLTPPMWNFPSMTLRRLENACPCFAISNRAEIQYVPLCTIGGLRRFSKLFGRRSSSW